MRDRLVGRVTHAADHFALCPRCLPSPPLCSSRWQVYRNIPGARITRRTHQVVEVPPLPDQEVFQTLLNLPLDERAGGYGDRSGNKQERYIAWMAADLLDFPDDPRALYYLGYGHLDLYNTHGGRPEARHIASLHKAVEYFTRRVDLPPAVGNKEERWFAMLKLAEIHERYLGQWDKAEAFYRRCIALDGERSDPYFYIGQHYRLIGSPAQAEADLYKAATLTAPVRSLFMWYHLYHCLSKLEYGRNHALRPSPTLQQCKRAIAVLDAADCSSGDPGNADEVRQLAQKARQQLQARREKRRLAKQRKAEAAEKAKLEEAEATAAAAVATQSDSSPETPAAASASGSAGRPLPDRLARKPAAIVAGDTKVATVRLALRVALECADELEQRARALVQQQGEAAPQSAAAAAADVHAELVASLAPLGDYLDAFTAIRGRKSRAVSRRADFLSCRRLRMAAADYLRLVDLRRQPIAASVAHAHSHICARNAIGRGGALRLAGCWCCCSLFCLICVLLRPFCRVYAAQCSVWQRRAQRMGSRVGGIARPLPVTPRRAPASEPAALRRPTAAPASRSAFALVASRCCHMTHTIFFDLFHLVSDASGLWLSSHRRHCFVLFGCCFSP